MTSSPYLTADEAAAYVRASSRKAFDHWASRRGVPYVKRGRFRLYRREVLDRVLAHDAMRVVRARKTA